MEELMCWKNNNDDNTDVFLSQFLWEMQRNSVWMFGVLMPEILIDELILKPDTGID